MKHVLIVAFTLAACLEQRIPGDDTGAMSQDITTTNYLQKGTSGGSSTDSSVIDDGITVSTPESVAFTHAGGAGTATAKFGALVSGSPGGWTYIADSEINAGYEYNGETTLYLNYDGYHGSTAWPRNTCVSDGQNGPCLIYTKGSTGFVGFHQTNPGYNLEVAGSFGLTPIGGGIGGLFFSNDSSVGHFTQGGGSTAGGFGWNVSSPKSPVDISNNGQVMRTDEDPVFTHELTNGNLLTYDTTAADRRAYGNFWDMSPQIGTGSHKLTTITLRLDARSPNKRVALWNDEGEVWQDTHVMYNVRPNGGGALAPTTTGICGGSVTPHGNDNMGRLQLGSGTTGLCQVTFAEAWLDSTMAAVTPACIVVDEAGGNTLPIAPSSTALSFTCTGCANHWIVWHCSGSDTNLAGP